MANPSRFTLSSEQLEKYYDRVALPSAERKTSVAGLTDDDQLQFLRTLTKHQVVRVPFESLTLHYSWHRVIDVKPLHVFRKIVDQSGRGGYCMEANVCFHTVLLTLRFRCYTVAARVYTDRKTWTGMTHLANIVTIGGQKYLVDVGFGPSEPIQPIPLIDGVVLNQVSPAESRLVLQTPFGFLSDAKLWIYQLRIDQNSPWETQHCFSDTEVLPQDIEVINLQPAQGRRSRFTQHVVCVRYTTAAETMNAPGLAAESTLVRSEIDGTIIINDNVFKWRRKGKKVAEITFQSDAERVQYLQDYFGIILDDEDIEAVKGTASEVRVSN